MVPGVLQRQKAHAEARRQAERREGKCKKARRRSVNEVAVVKKRHAETDGGAGDTGDDGFSAVFKRFNEASGWGIGVRRQVRQLFLQIAARAENSGLRVNENGMNVVRGVTLHDVRRQLVQHGGVQGIAGFGA